VISGRRPEPRTGPAYRHRQAAGREPRATTVRWVILAVLALSLVACGGTFTGATLSDQVTNWATSSGLSASVSELQGDIRRIDAVADHPASVKTDCVVLVTDALTANGNLPSPDQALTTLLSHAYSVAGDAGHDCVAGAGAGVTALARSAMERITAQRDLIKAMARFDAVTTG
jgi:hypothetical protein